MLESQTRTFIDEKLKRIGRDIANPLQVVFELPVKKWEKDFFADYVLLESDGKVIAIIEAKKFSRSARDGEHQALEYAQLISNQQGFMPFIFLSNGKEIYYMSPVEHEPIRKIKTFFTLSDLRRLKFLYETRRSPLEEKINAEICGRHYQIWAIKSVLEWIETGRRKFLLVMATGTGKTRTAMGLIDVMIKTHNAQKVLFLTDRTALRDQAFDDWFKAFFSDEPKTKIQSGKTDDTARLYTANYQTLINYLDKYSSWFFDMIIIDEVHRSLYGEWKSILEHFDCYQVWLTATPVDFVEKSTYKAFDCHEKWPQYNYGLDEAIQEWYLVPYKVLMARTQFQIQGIKGHQLPKDLREQLIKEGKNPEDYNFEGSEIGKKIDNKDTNRAVVKEFMEQAYTIEDGLPGKSIIFAMNQKHAEHLQEAFEELYPHLRHFSVVITSNVERADQLLKDFKKFKTEKKYRVAISVDMLDTGVDVPEVVNLVFAKKVLSEAKFRQMVGRWTRLCPNVYGPGQDKKDFLILDFGLNFDEDHTFKAPWLKALSLQQQYFELQLQLLKLYENRKDSKQFNAIKKWILNMVKALPENDELLHHHDLLQNIVTERIFNNVAVNPYEQLQKIAPLMRYRDSHTADELRFLIKSDKLIIAVIKGEETDELRDKIASDINALSMNIAKVQEKHDLIVRTLSPNFWEPVSVESVELLKKEFTKLMKYKDPSKPEITVTDIEDTVIERRWIEYTEGKKMASDKYRGVFVSQLEGLANSSSALKKILSDEEPTSQERSELEQLLDKSEYHLNIINLKKAFGRPTARLEQLIKVALGKISLPGREKEVGELFESFIQQHNFSSHQIRFLQIVKSLIIQKKFVTSDDFYSATFEGTLGIGAYQRLFKEEEQKLVEGFVERFRV